MILDLDSPPKGTVREWLDHRAGEDGVAFIFTEDGTTLRWSELRAEAGQVASQLTMAGHAKGESIAILHPNGRAGVIAVYGALYGGFRATMINLAAGRDAIAYALEHSDARTAFVHESVAEIFAAARPASMTRFVAGAIPAAWVLHDITPKDHALLMYTSGTTGRPKGVVHTHASLLAGGWTTTIAHGLRPEDRGLCVLPIYHINGLCVSLMGALVSGGSIAMAPRFSAGQFWSDAG
ncbi:MAG: class I adenylate-forming enzyme family protein, partial [Roseovarius sp.]|nr:class I adenylate-forming enzyme family protein [Roseovarius sp.]